MKKFLKISGISIGVLLLAMIALPFLFKDKIKGIIDEQIAKNINGKVWYNAESFSLSLFTHFPNLTVSLEDIGLMSNVKEFKGVLVGKVDRAGAADDAGLQEGDIITKINNIETFF